MTSLFTPKTFDDAFGDIEGPKVRPELHAPMDYQRAPEWQALMGYKCDYCQDAGFVVTAIAVPTRRIVCPRCGDVEQPEWDAARFGCPAKLANATLASWGPGNARELIACRNYLTTWPPEQPWLALLGLAGRGKTGAAVGVVREAYERHNVGGRFTTVYAALNRFKATFNNDDRTETTERVMDDLITRPLLVLDDLGAEAGTNWASEQIFAVINGRDEALKPTIVTADETSSGWQAMHARVKSRVMSGAVVRFQGPDRRAS